MIDMVSELLNQLVNSFLNLINEIGYFGIFIGMTIESSFIPFPSEIILIPAGVLAARGEMSILLIFIVSLLGSLFGAAINYFVGYFIGRKAVDFYISQNTENFLLSEKKLRKTDNYFEKYGDVTTFVGRLIPGIRQLISLPAGFAKMNIKKFFLFTSLGAGIWSIFLIYVGYFIGKGFMLFEEFLNILVLGLVILSVIIAIFYLNMKKRIKAARY